MPHTCCTSKSFGSNAIDFCSSNAINQYAPSKVIEPVHLDISLNFYDLTSEIVQVKVIITFKHKGGALVSNLKDLTEISLNAENFENVTVTSEDQPVDFRYDGRLIRVMWKEPFQKGTERKVIIEYILDHPIAGLYFQKRDAIIGNTNPIWAITDHETEKARCWLPTVDYPTVRTTLSWTIRAPEGLTSLANGTLKHTETKDGFTTTKWELLEYPCPSYLIAFAVGDFAEVDDGQVDGKPIKYFADKAYKKEDILRSFNRTPDMIRWLQKKVGVPFPWSKYYQVAAPSIRGAMENISLVTWCDAWIIDEVNAQERKLLVDMVNIHEMGHTYFGDLLVIKHFEHAWLKESWATYIESCWLEDNESEDAFRFEMHENATAYFSECETYMRPIVTRRYDSSWDMFDRHLYPGGAWRVHMLRKRLGDEAFWHGVKTYIERFATKTVQTSDFQNCLEEASGLNLTRYFDEWLMSKGYPKLQGQYEASGETVKITMTQSPNNDQVPIFGFDLDIEVTTDAHKTYSGKMTFDKWATEFTVIQLPKGEKVTQICVDPEAKVLFSLSMPSVDRDVLIETAKNGKDIVNRIWAYSELVSSGSRPALKAVHDSILKEPFYGVRVYCAKKLASLNSNHSIRILADLLAAEKDPLALAPIASVCNIVNDQLRMELLVLLKRESLPYRAHAAALNSLGSQRNAEDLDYLLQVAKDDTKIGQHGLIRSGALRALGLHRSEEGFKYLLSRVGYNKEPLRARPSAIEGLAHSADWQTNLLKKQAIEEISTLIRDPNPSIRFQAVESLIGLKVKTISGSLSNTRYMYPEDDHSWLDRKLRQLNEIGSENDKGSKEAIEKLESRIKKLEEKLSSLEI